MRTHTAGFKNAIKQFGKEISAKITYGNTTLSGEDLNSISYHYEGAILKSVMKQLDIDSNVDIPLETTLNLQFGVKVNSSYEYLNYGNFVVYKSEKREDMSSYKLTCYDKMLYAMKDYESLDVTYPITIRNYISTICSHLGLTFANSSDTFVNYDKTIPSELYLDNDGNSLGYTFRDVLDELAEVTASTICINDDDGLEIRYITIAEDESLIDMGQNSRTQYGLTITTNGAHAHIIGNPTSASTIYLTDEKISASISAGAYKLSIDHPKDKVRFGIYFYSEDDTYILGMSIPVNSVSKTFNLMQDAFYYRIAIIPTTIAVDFNDDFIFTLNEENSINTIDEEYLKDINVNFGKQYGPINTIVFSRSGGADKISLSQPENLPDASKNAITIEDNQILNDNNRGDFISEILTKLYGLQYYINDFSSPGIAYLELGDKYNVKIGENTYSCVMLNDELNITQGLEEMVYTEMPTQAETDYTKTTKTDKLINKTNLIVDKVNQEISGVLERVEEVEENAVTTTQMNNAITQKITDNNENYITSQISSAINTADSHTDNKLGNYSTSTQVTNEITQKIDANNNTYTSVELAKKVNSKDVTKAYLMLILTGNRSSSVLGADEISLSANDILNLIAGNTINLKSRNLTITSDYLTISKYGVVNIGNSTQNNAKLNVSGTVSLASNNYNLTTSLFADGFKIVDTDNNRTPVSLTANEAYYNGINYVYASLRLVDSISNNETNITSAQIVIKPFNGYANDGVTITKSGIWSPGYNNASQAIKKKNFKLLTNALEIIKKGDIYSYNWKTEEDNHKKHYGLVIGDNFKTPEEVITDNKEGIDIYAMTSILWEAVKEQQEIIEQLKERISILERK